MASTTAPLSPREAETGRTARSGPGGISGAAAGLTLLFVALAVYYNVTTPIFEAPDELWHYLVAADLAQGHFADPNGPARQEATQPPLYYGLAALLWNLAPAPAPDTVLHLNPYFDYRPGDSINLNFVYHGEPGEQFPYAGLARSVHLVRLLSVLFGASTVLGGFVLGRLIAPEAPRVAVLSAGFVALLPQFLFLSGAINNDLAVIALSTWTLVLLARWVRGEANSRAGEAILALTLGLAILSKATALGLALVVGVALIRYAPSSEGLARRLARAAGVLGGALLVGGWWYVRLWALYRDPLGTASRDIALGRSTPYSLGEALVDLRELGLTFVARFGATNLAPPVGVSLAYLIVVGLGLVLGGRAILRAPRPARSIQLLWMAVILVLFYLWQLSVPGPQGRLVFPALASFAGVWAIGVDTAARRFPRRIARTGLGALGAVSLLGAFALPGLTIGPAYRPRADRLLAALPAEASPTRASFGEQVNLVGYELPTNLTGGGLSRLFWTRGPRPTSDLSFFLHAVDSGGQVVAGADAALAPSLPLSAWPTDRVVEIDVAFDHPLRAGSTDRLEVGTYRLVNGAIQPVNVGTTRVTAFPLAVLQPGAPARLEGQPPVARFGEAGGAEIDLLGWTLDADSAWPGGQISGRLLWSAPAALRTDYTVFVHLSREGKLVAQYDAPPVHGFFPTTAWRSGVLVEDPFIIPLPDHLERGPAQIELGLYDARTLRRLKLASPDGSPDSYGLTSINIDQRR